MTARLFDAAKHALDLLEEVATYRSIAGYENSRRRVDDMVAELKEALNKYTAEHPVAPVQSGSTKAEKEALAAAVIPAVVQGYVARNGFHNPTNPLIAEITSCLKIAEAAREAYLK